MNTLKTTHNMKNGWVHWESTATDRICSKFEDTYYVFNEGLGILGYPKNFQHYWVVWVDPAIANSRHLEDMAANLRKDMTAGNLPWASDLQKQIAVEIFQEAFPEDF